jgi:hypothetical protein
VFVKMWNDGRLNHPFVRLLRVGGGYSLLVSTGVDTASPMTATPFVPRSTSIVTLAHAAADCRGCPLFLDTTQTVFGERRPSAPMMARRAT